MRNLKKVLALVVVFAMMLSTVAFAAVPSQVSEGIEDQDVKDAVERLVAFGIVAGKEDGKYHPEEALTRAQFAKLAVEALGLGAAAQAAGGATQFSDVAADHWAAGYISVAAGQGIVMGKGDGTFAPEAGVSYPEAVTMLVRTLGYKDSFLPGAWPSNYVAKAADLDITDDVNYTTSGVVDRGSAAVLVDNTLDAEVIVQATYGDENNWEESGKKLFEKALGVSKIKDVTIASVPRTNGGLDADQIQISYTTTAGAATKTLEFENINADQLFGLKADIYYDNDDLVYADIDNDYKFIYDEVDLDGADTIDGDNKSDFLITDKEYEFEDDVVVYINNSQLADADTDGTVVDELEPIIFSEKLFGKFVFNEKGKIAFVDAFDFESKFDGIVVTNVDGEKIEYFKDSDSTTELDLADDADAYVIYDNTGAQVDVADIAADDVLYIADTTNASTGDTDYFVIFVASESKEGTLEEYEGTENVVVGDKSYNITARAIKTSSIDADDNIDPLSTSDLEDLLDENVKVIFDLGGEVRHIVGAAKATSDDMYGLVIGTNTSFGDESVKVFTQTGEKVVYDLDIDTPVPAGFEADVSNLTDSFVEFVRYTLDKDGEINEIEVLNDDVTVVSGGSSDYTSTVGDAGEYGKTTIEINGTEYFVNEDALIFDLEEYISTGDTDDIKFVSWSSLADENVAAGTLVTFDANSKNSVKVLAFGNGASTTIDDTFYGYIKDVKKTSDGYKATIDVTGEGVKEYVVEDTTANETNVEGREKKVMKFTINSKDEVTYDAGATIVADSVSAYVYDIDGSYVKFAYFTDADSNNEYNTGDTYTGMVGGGAGTWYKVTSDTIYYDGTTKKDFYDLDEGKTSIAALVDGVTVKAVKIK